MRYEVQCLMANGDWRNTTDETFGNKAEAEADLADFIEDCEYSVRMGYMADFNANDWRVQGYDDYDGPDLDDSYQIYLGCIEGTGQPVKDYDEWLQS